jgi:hypothetical protein
VEGCLGSKHICESSFRTTDSNVYRGYKARALDEMTKRWVSQAQLKDSKVALAVVFWVQLWEISP